MKLAHLGAGAIYLGIALVIGYAWAPGALAAVAAVTPNTGDIPWGDAVAQVGDNFEPAVKTTLNMVIMGVLVKYAGPFGMLIRQSFVSDLVDKAVNYAFAVTLGAQRGKTISAETMPEFLRNVVRYGNTKFPWVLRFIIGKATDLLEMALARAVNEIPAEFKYQPSDAPSILGRLAEPPPATLLGRLAGAVH